MLRRNARHPLRRSPDSDLPATTSSLCQPRSTPVDLPPAASPRRHFTRSRGTGSEIRSDFSRYETRLERACGKTPSASLSRHRLLCTSPDEDASDSPWRPCSTAESVWPNHREGRPYVNSYCLRCDGPGRGDSPGEGMRSDLPTLKGHADIGRTQTNKDSTHLLSAP